MSKTRQAINGLLLMMTVFLLSTMMVLTSIAPAHAANSGSLDYSVRIKASMDMTISSDSVALTLNPANNAFGTGALNIAVGTNNPGGYRLFMSTDDGSTSLVKTDDDTKTIETLPSNGSTGYTADTFVADKWGYKVGSGNYFPFVSGGMVNSSSTAVNNHITNITFGAKASYEKTAGTYNTTLSFTTLPKVTTYNMQDSNVAEVCTETPALVTDSRDGTVYFIARLEDGNCWMLQNLKLGKNTESLNLTTANSDVPSGGFTLNGKLSDGKFTNTDGYNNDNSQYYCTNDYGCYYNWYTATAGSGSSATTSGDVANSICPAGWTLPTGGSKGQFKALATAYGGTDAAAASAMLVSPTSATENTNGAAKPGFLLSGFYGLSGAASIGSFGNYWSRTASSDHYGYNLSLHASGVSPATNNVKYSGQAVRCVLKEGPKSIDDIETMQEFAALDTDTKVALIDSMDTTKSYALKDARDNKYYNIAKLADGKVWMTTSLNLAGGTKLYSETSDVPAGYPESGGTGYFTLPTSSTSGFSDDTVAYAYNAPNKNNPDPSNPTTCTPANASPCDSYYSWLTATAGGKDANGSAVTDNGYNAAYSVCPKGWRLPTATTSNASPYTSPNWKTGDNYKLATAYGANLESNYYDNSSATGANFYNNAGPGTLPNFLLTGFYYSSSFHDGGSYGGYWSSSLYSSMYAYYLHFSSSRVYSVNNEYRRVGFPVRCILKEGPSNINEIETMQELGKTELKTEVLASMDSSTAYTLKDERDNKYYKVVKLADGKVWMTTSLNLAGGTKLNASDSDVPTDNYFTLPTSSTSGFSSDTTAYVYNAPNKNNPDPSNPTTCTPADGSPCDSYYSWRAATAGGLDVNGSAVTSNGYNAAYSVCPKGWRLPTATTSNASPYTSPNWKTGDNYKLATAYGANLESNYYDNSSATGANFYNNAGPGTLPNFLLAGSYNGGSFRNGGSDGIYWSSSSISSTDAYYLVFSSSSVYSAVYNNRRFGFPVRCILGGS